jgi:hypothetical protein
MHTACSIQRTTSYIFPVELLNLMRQPAESQKLSIENEMENMAENIVINYDGSITLYCTEEQRIRWIEHIDPFLSERLYEWSERDGIPLWISEDKREFEITFNPDEANLLNLGVLMVALRSQCYLYQLFTNVPRNKILVSFTIINEKNGNIVLQETFPGDDFEIKPEDWD